MSNRTDPLEAARAALRTRQGGGARYDDPAAPAEMLLLARRGTAFFARKLNGLSDADLTAPSNLPGWTRAHVVAHVGYEARALAELASGAEFLPPDRERIEQGATLPTRALRHLFDHSAVHLNVIWRDLSAADWSRPVDVPGAALLAGTVRLRAAALWRGAVDLRCGTNIRDLPAEFQTPATGDARTEAAI